MRPPLIEGVAGARQAGMAVPAGSVPLLPSLESLQDAMQQLQEWRWRFSVKGKLERVVETVAKQFASDLCCLQVRHRLSSALRPRCRPRPPVSRPCPRAAARAALHLTDLFRLAGVDEGAREQGPRAAQAVH